MTDIPDMTEKSSMKNHEQANAEIAPDSFELFLRQQLQQKQTYLDDGDFSARVMASLPAPRKLSRLQERLILLLPVAIISVLILSQFSLASGIKAWYALITMDFANLLTLGLVLAVTAVSSACYWIARQIRLI
jgi:hypothetical protein